MHRARVMPWFFLLISCVNFLVAQDRKVALVIGNSAYASVIALPNPRNDASDMAAALNRLGFEVIPVLDGSYIQMDDAILQFSQRLSGAHVGLFYYAGHGVQSNGNNYLLPVDANIQSEFQLKQKSMDVSYVLDAMSSAGSPLNIIILDACRDNPWEKAGRTIGGSRGLSMINTSPQGAVIAYATEPGSIAQDGTGRNGVYTAALLKYITTDGLNVKELFDKVGADVSLLTNGAQTPWVSSKFYGKYSLGAGDRSSITPTSPNSSSKTTPGSVNSGRLLVTSVSAGILSIDAKPVVNLQPGIEVGLDNILIGERNLEIRYRTGGSATATIVVQGGQRLKIAFSGNESVAVSIASDELLVPVPQTTIKTPPNVESPQDFKVGDTGPAGGLVFYDKGRYADGWRYLEAAPQKNVVLKSWVKNVFQEIYAINTKSGVGTGKGNTEAILATQKDGNYAAAFCKNLTVKGFSDWFLPSIGELNELSKSKTFLAPPGFDTYLIWSSSSGDDSRFAWCWDSRRKVLDGGKNIDRKSNELLVWAVRRF